MPSWRSACSKRRDAAGIRVPKAAIERGLTDVEWPGRLELIRLGRWRARCCSTPRTTSTARGRSPPICERGTRNGRALVIGVMRDKDVDGIIGALLPVVSSVIATAAHTPRALPADDLAARIRPWGSGVRRAHRARPGGGGRAGAGERPHGVRGGLDLRGRGGSRPLQTPCYPAVTL